MSVALILAEMLALPPSKYDAGESEAARTELFRPVAESIDRVAKTTRQRALLIAQTFEDTGGARYVYEGRCKDGPRGARCDDGRSHGPWQVAVRYCPTTDLDEQARCALKAAGGGLMRCREHSLSPDHALFVGLAGNRVSCSWRGASKRVKTFRRVLARLEAAEIQEKLTLAREADSGVGFSK